MTSGRTPLRCLIVDDSVTFVDAARTLLSQQGLTIVGVAHDSAEAIARVGEVAPDVALVDVNLGAESGFSLAEQWYRDGLGSSCAVILISTLAEIDLADLIAASPAAGFLAKEDLSAENIRALVDGVDLGDDGASSS